MTLVRPNRGKIVSVGIWTRRKAFRIARAIVQPIRNPSRDSIAAFFVGSGRSGTDVVVGSLGESVDAKLVNEDNPEGFENWRLREWDVIEDLVGKSFARVVLFKPIVQTWQVREMMGHFDDSRAVFIARGWPDSVNSIARFFGEGVRRAVSSWVATDFEKVSALGVSPSIQATVRENWDPEISVHDSAAIYWYVYNAAYRSLNLDRDPRVLLTFYEDVVREPEAEFRRICEHLGLAYHSRMIRDVGLPSTNVKTEPPVSAELRNRCEEVWQDLLLDRNSSKAVQG